MSAIKMVGDNQVTKRLHMISQKGLFINYVKQRGEGGDLPSRYNRAQLVVLKGVVQGRGVQNFSTELV